MATSRNKKLVNKFNDYLGPVINPATDTLVIGNHTELLKQSIQRLIFTRIGTRMGNLDYGTTIPDLPFTNDPIELRNILSYEISEALQRFEPRASLIDIEIENIYNEIVEFTIRFLELETNTTQTLPIEADFTV